MVKYNYTKKAEIEVLFALVRFIRSFVEILKSTASHPFQMPGVRLSQSKMLFLRLVIISLSVLFVCIVFRNLVGALSLDVARLLALVASSLAGGLGWAVSGEMSDFTAVVALLALGAVT